MARAWEKLLGFEGGVEETPEQQAGFFGRLRDSLSQSRRALTQQFAGFDPNEEDAWERLEEALIGADVGVPATAELVRRLEERGGLESLEEELAALLGEPGTLNIAASPSVVLVVGVNGTGKTTTIGKLASKFHEHGRSVLLAAADTFRAAAEEQLEIWAERAQADFVGAPRGGDPAAVAYDAIEAAIARGRDVVIVDTAGRLHNRVNLMNELNKIRRVAGRAADGAPHEVLLVLDATVGQNGVQQAREFTSVAGVTGIVLTKLDGTAKGGVAVAIAHDLKLPIRYVGVGEGIEDLVPFSAEEYVDGLFEEKW